MESYHTKRRAEDIGGPNIETPPPKKKPWVSSSNTCQTPQFRGETFQEAIQTNNQDTLDKYIFPKLSSTPSTDTFKPEDCFLSHRGPDTKLDLVVPLSRMMYTLYNTTSFVDCEPTNMLARAQAASTADAIAQSIWACKVIVIFISTTFHESEWCLKELYTSLYRREKKDDSLKALHIVYCQGMSPKVCEGMPEYAGLDLGNIWGTEFKEGTALQEFASNQLHKVLYQLIHGTKDSIESNAAALAEWRKLCRHRFGIPPKLEYFMGREDELSEITKTLQNHCSAAITASGVGGVGKSQLVVSWVHQNLYKYSIVVWIRAEQNLTLKQDLADFGEQELGLHFNDKEDIDQRARRTLQAIKNSSTSTNPALIIFDNAESYIGLLDQDWIPPLGSYCHSVVTTRDSSSCSNEQQVKVGPLDESSSLAIMEYFLQREVNTIHETSKALEMLESFEFLPLAIVNFAVFASKFGLDDAIAKIQCIMEKPVYDKRNYQGQHRKSVDAVLQAQYDALDDGAQTVLGYLSVLAAENIPTSLLKSLFEGYHEGMEQLMDRAIVLSGGGPPGMVSTHRLFQYTTMQRSRAHEKFQTQLNSVAECLVIAMKDEFDDGGHHNRKNMSSYLPHVQALVGHHWPNKTASLGKLFYWYGRTMKNQAQYTEAMELYEQALVIQGSALGKDHPEYATTLHNMANVHYNQGRYTKAMELYEQALAITGSALGKDHPSYASTLHNMASVHKKQGRYTKAMELYEQALAIQGSALGKDHPSSADTLHSMASVHRKQGGYTEAMELYEQALTITGSALGKDHPSYADTLHSMASVHKKQGGYTEAMELYEQALVIQGSALGKDHPEYATTLHNMANVHYNQGGYTKAMELYEQALAITGSALGKDHPSYAATLHNMASVHKKQGRYTKAMELYEQALAIKGSAALGKDHPSYAITLLNIGSVHFKQGNFDQSLDLCQQAHDILIKAYNGNEQQPDVVKARKWIERFQRKKQQA